LFGLPLQVLALPWLARSGMLAALGVNPADPGKVYEALETRIAEFMQFALRRIDSSLPVILAAHCSVQGATYGAERSVMLGSDLVLSGSLVRDPRLDYVALGHIHKSQNLNEGAQPPVVYPGSIERVDWGEATDEKHFVIAHLEKGVPTLVEWRKLEGRRFIDRSKKIETEAQIEGLHEVFGDVNLQDAIVRLTLTYPRRWETRIDEPAIRKQVEGAFEFHLVRKPEMESRLRLGDRTISSLSPSDLLDLFWQTLNMPGEESGKLQKLAGEIFAGDAPAPEESGEEQAAQ
jgi:exonuclease SbcD